MSFVFDKCAALEMRRGRQVDSTGIDLPDDQHIGEIGEENLQYTITQVNDAKINISY